MNKVKVFVKDSVEEMTQRVSWPSYKQLQNSSVLVLVASLIFALVIGLIDLGFKEIMDRIYQTF